MLNVIRWAASAPAAHLQQQQRGQCSRLHSTLLHLLQPAPDEQQLNKMYFNENGTCCASWAAQLAALIMMMMMLISYSEQLTHHILFPSQTTSWDLILMVWTINHCQSFPKRPRWPSGSSSLVVNSELTRESSSLKAGPANLTEHPLVKWELHLHTLQ